MGTRSLTANQQGRAGRCPLEGYSRELLNKSSHGHFMSQYKHTEHVQHTGYPACWKCSHVSYCAQTTELLNTNRQEVCPSCPHQCDTAQSSGRSCSSSCSCSSFQPCQTHCGLKLQQFCSSRAVCTHPALQLQLGSDLFFLFLNCTVL